MVLPLVAAALLAVPGCSSAPASCGWDLSSPEGQRANAARLDEVSVWLTAHPGEPVPDPTSTYWHGACPTPSGSLVPPHEEGDEGGDLGPEG